MSLCVFLTIIVLPCISYISIVLQPCVIAKLCWNYFVLVYDNVLNLKASKNLWTLIYK
jgi:hypothetical protein